MGEIIGVTKSVCPICFKTLKAYKIKKNKDIYINKKCKEHGKFETIIWRESPSYNSWKRPKSAAYPESPFTETSNGCPHDCGLCGNHRQHTCTALIEVTQKCNLNCKFCFANSGKNSEPDIETIKYYYQRVMKASGNCNIQLSGGEPTLRDDLDEIIKLGHDMGFSFIQLNTNGLKLKDLEYVKKLKEAGLNSVFLQFDGMDDKIYSTLRGKKLLSYKMAAVENLKKMGIGVILVCTVVPVVNDYNLYEIVKYGIENIPAVRGVHFQPVSYFGRIPNTPKDKDRITLPEVMNKLCKQSDGLINIKDFNPPGCENAFCSFHSNYIEVDNKLIPVSGSGCGCKEEKGEEGSRKAKDFVKRNWTINKTKSNNKGKYKSFDELARKIKENFFSISAMAFQDAWNLDIQRLRDCCIHVVSKEGNLIPFCAYNLTNKDGKSLYRGD
ncbi:radical SAM (seleno)protein TrsS [Tepidibacter aestuarii]|uniref:radical SAM (seleno)protein TrsS n=1 Tax=Tepidibacter aestuarii TaxID=2925782 RepID=UPI0020C10D94|nr:radical SAM (seleno)protein TrsS [Tepidibacter aestuarii]CAH2213318.1 7,8-dihydro-6-hydroxymethylpterin dimethyltransferase [Tepidibacter aestuarii]